MTLYKNLIYNASIGEAGLYDLAVPDATRSDGFDLFIYIHGGGLENGSKNYDPLLTTLADDYGIMTASINYRLYHDVRFPTYICDCAKAIAVILREAKQYAHVRSVTVGGSSAGGYLSMMLFFDPQYLRAEGVSPNEIDRWFFDAGQPTTHFNILAYERGLDPIAIRVDEAAPIYFIDHAYTETDTLPHLHFVWSEYDMVARPEQSELTLRLLRHYGYPENKLHTTFMKGYRHCAYIAETAVFAKMIADALRA